MSDTISDRRHRVLIADDHDMIAELMSMLLSTTPDLVAVVCSSLEAALTRESAEGPFDVVLLDYHMPGMNGVEGLRRMTAIRAGRPVAIITGAPTPAMVDQVMAAGAAGVIPKTASMRSLVNALRFIQAGEVYLPLDLVTQREAARAEAGQIFTPKELLVLRQLGDGKPNKVIALDLSLAEPTIKMHVKAICRKLGVSNRTQAVIAARDRGLL